MDLYAIDNSEMPISLIPFVCSSQLEISPLEFASILNDARASDDGLCKTLSSLKFHFEGRIDQILLRRVRNVNHGSQSVAADLKCVDFHFDNWPRTMHVALNDECEYEGARSVYLSDTLGWCAISRPAGSAIVHTHEVWKRVLITVNCLDLKASSFILPSVLFLIQALHGATVLKNGVRYSLFLMELFDERE
jgi:hypothetical protein